MYYPMSRHLLNKALHKASQRAMEEYLNSPKMQELDMKRKRFAADLREMTVKEFKEMYRDFLVEDTLYSTFGNATLIDVFDWWHNEWQKRKKNENTL